MTIEDIIIESLLAKKRFWFVDTLEIIERTDNTVTLHFTIGSDLFVQIFFSQCTTRFSFALIGKSGRLYGRDREHGFWHCHTFEQPEQHDPTPKGMSPQPIIQFLAEVEEILIKNDLI